MQRVMEVVEEWMKQAAYDLGTAEAMFEAARYIYCVFMCHLSIEKVLKAHYIKRLKMQPPKTHDLIYLCEKAKIHLPKAELIFIDKLNALSVPTRYPDSLNRILKQYDKIKTKEILKSSKRIFLWLRKNN